MSVVIDVIESWSSMASSQQENSRNHRRGFTVAFDTSSPSNAIQARLATGIPQRGQSHPNDPYAVVMSIDSEPLSPVLYNVTVSYSVKSGGTSGEDSPLDEPWEISLTWASTNEQVDTDIEGNPIENVNGEPFDPPLTMDVDDPVLQITRNQPSFDFTQAWRYRNAINSDSFYGANPGEARMAPITAQRIVEGSLTYWRATYQIRFRLGTDNLGGSEKAWQRRLLNQGFKEKVDRDGATYIERVLDGQGNPVMEPIKLLETGYRWVEGQEPYWIYFKLRPSLPFSVFDLQ